MMMHLCEMGTRLVVTFKDRSELTPQLYKKLLSEIESGKYSVIVIRKFVEEKVCQEWKVELERLAESTQDSGEAPRVKVLLGQRFSETKGKPEGKEAYFENTRKHAASLQQFFQPVISFMDKTFPGGAKMMEFGEGKRFSPGLARQLIGDVDGHENKLERDFDQGDIPEDFHGASQIAAYVCVEAPLVGGEMIFSNRSLDTETYERMKGDSHGISLPALGLPDVVLKPQRGDLILFNSRNLHATRGVPIVEKPQPVAEERSEDESESDVEILSEDPAVLLRGHEITDRGNKKVIGEESTTLSPKTNGNVFSPGASPLRAVRDPPPLGNLIVLSSFMLLRGAEKPLLFWS
uniref:Uncharacterized protein n=1 Tax=Chromera velia CCMP2878 TaxID=1169474 RepID=A0A0G4GFY6_9ALVE|eukprot:Cvel_21715.t1-p1 / transcript=Cvel_21715.t1 / gene=Cvel_21715 / organism=Chromera_velia_CCMP2878 / gene_product=hypothetical protein / transcript_product=hypothetical protein / location=Cvel_scaffold2060:29025-30068(+) / protein_length=348 / sequence_SO=supercontig / SO=protein_coding / is_pseudo=false